MAWDKKNKFMALSLATLFIATGTYNAVVINSDSNLNEKEARFVKRLDEMYGVTIEGRKIATATNWEKLGPAKIVKAVQKEEVPVVVEAERPEPDAVEQSSFIQDQLTLSLVEVINPIKWQKGVSPQSFSGSLLANSGVIEELTVSLPDGEGVSVSFTEMSGNVFNYDLNGESFSGMMYQVDQHSYMVTFTNGPLEGTRLRFSSQDPAQQQIQIQNSLADNDIQPGNFGEVSPLESQLGNDIEIQPETSKAQGFNFDQQVL